MSWNTTVTNKGSALITTAIQNGDIEFTKALGSTNLSGATDITTVTEVSEPQYSIAIKSVDVIGDNTRIVVRIMNDGVTEDYSIKQIGIFAKLKDSSEEILFSISENPYGQEVPSVENCPEFVCDVYIIVRVDNRIKQSVSVQSGIYAEIGHTHNVEDIEDISERVQMVEVPFLSGASIKEYAETHFSAQSDAAYNVEFAVRIYHPSDGPFENADFFFKIYKINVRHIRIVAIDIRKSQIYELVKYNGIWASEWTKTSDGGDADTVDGKHADGLVQRYVLNAGTDTKVAQGASNQTMTVYTCSKWVDYPPDSPDAQGTIITIAYNTNPLTEVTTEGKWFHQIFLSPYVHNIWMRTYYETTYTGWEGIALSNDVIPKNMAFESGASIKEYAEKYDASTSSYGMTFLHRIMNATDAPTGEAKSDFYYIMNKVDSKYISIVAIDIRSNEMYKLSKVNDVWGEWKNITTTFDYLDYNNYVAIPANADLDNYKEAGIYSSIDMSVSKTLKNAPSSGSGFYMEVYCRSATNVTQRVMLWMGQEYVRYFNGTTWTSWKCIVKDLDKWSSGSIKDKLRVAVSSGFVFIEPTCTDLPSGTNTYWFGIINRAEVHRQLTIHSIDGGMTYCITYNHGLDKWYDWHNLADGGNADMVDGKHASDLLQNFGYLNSGSLLDYVLTMKASGFLYVSSAVTDTPVAGQFFFVDVRRYENGSYAITATRFNAGGVYTNRYNNNTDMKKWYGWSNAADGGNAITLNGISSSEYLRQPRHGVEVGTNPATATDTRGIYFKGKTGDTYATAGIMNAVDTSGNVATTIDARNNTRSGQTIYRLFIKVGIDGTGFLSVTAPSSSGMSALRNLASGSSAATTSNCPAGSWYGQYE